MSDTPKNLQVNPYFVFLAQFRENLKSRGLTNIKATTVAQMAGKKWRQMSDAQKAIYSGIAQRNRETRSRGYSV
ncbi:uncharacterized protein LOC135427204 [Drosophila montana]|uniref:uncharacterized protein LOC135427204 n=1 Tax=Drosophila montana TaxID=40370 RepID=UPI00313D5BAF